ncbi:hypothetical protein HY491_02360 [Candidatus Woesearchaeota archaeon]|nr:hypothetical protein [Candidatus Woesearchaeota archaeon]
MSEFVADLSTTVSFFLLLIIFKEGIWYPIFRRFSNSWIGALVSTAALGAIAGTLTLLTDWFIPSLSVFIHQRPFPSKGLWSIAVIGMTGGVCVIYSICNDLIDIRKGRIQASSMSWRYFTVIFLIGIGFIILSFLDYNNLL